MAFKYGIQSIESMSGSLGYVVGVSAPGEALSQMKPELLYAVGLGESSSPHHDFSRELYGPGEDHGFALGSVDVNPPLFSPATFRQRATFGVEKQHNPHSCS